MSNVNPSIPGPPDGLFDLKFHQLSVYHADPEKAIHFWKERGYDKWLYDFTRLVGTECDEPIDKHEEVWFNYDLFNHEFEYIRYDNGQLSRLYPHENGQHGPFMSHWATFVDDLDSKMEEIQSEFGLKPYCLVRTFEHKSPVLNASRKRFYQCLYDTRRLLGHDVKLMQRVMPGDRNYPHEARKAAFSHS